MLWQEVCVSAGNLLKQRVIPRRRQSIDAAEEKVGYLFKMLQVVSNIFYCDSEGVTVLYPLNMPIPILLFVYNQESPWRRISAMTVLGKKAKQRQDLN